MKVWEQVYWSFVQAGHNGLAEQLTHFQKFLNPQIDCIWFYEVPSRQVLGLAPSLGHGVLFKTSDIIEVNGFPSVVSEDIGLTLSLAQKNMFGLYDGNIVGQEAFPRSYRDYWKRRRRWIQADAEIIKKMLSKLWKSQISLSAKIDLTFRETRLAVSSLYWLLLIAISLIEVFMPDNYNIKVSATYEAYILFSLIPSLIVFLIKRLSFLGKIKYLLFMPFIGMASSSINPIATVSGFLGKSHFEPTGSRISISGIMHYAFFETTTSLLLIICGLIAFNLFLVAAGVAIGCSQLMRTLSPKFEVLVIYVGSVIFWILLLSECLFNFRNGTMSIYHLLVLFGITLTLF